MLPLLCILFMFSALKGCKAGTGSLFNLGGGGGRANLQHFIPWKDWFALSNSWAKGNHPFVQNCLSVGHK